MPENPMDWLQFVMQVGFPGAVALLLMHWVSRRIERGEARTDSREQLMSKRIAELEDKIENELVELVRDQGTLITEAKGALSVCANVLQDVSAVFGKLKQSSAFSVASDSDILIRGHGGHDERREASFTQEKE